MISCARGGLRAATLRGSGGLLPAGWVDVRHVARDFARGSVGALASFRDGLCAASPVLAPGRKVAGLVDVVTHVARSAAPDEPAVRALRLDCSLVACGLLATSCRTPPNERRTSIEDAPPPASSPFLSATPPDPPDGTGGADASGPTDASAPDAEAPITVLSNKSACEILTRRKFRRPADVLVDTSQGESLARRSSRFRRPTKEELHALLVDSPGIVLPCRPTRFSQNLEVWQPAMRCKTAQNVCEFGFRSGSTEIPGTVRTYWFDMQGGELGLAAAAAPLL